MKAKKKSTDSFSSNSHKGAASELQAAYELMASGHEVFRNLSPCGPADLIAWHPVTGALMKFDVKTATGALTKRQKSLDIRRFIPGDIISSTTTKHLRKRHRCWYVRFVVPQGMRALVGRREMCRTLQTNDLATARTLAPAVLIAFQREIAEAALGKGVIAPTVN